MTLDAALAEWISLLGEDAVMSATAASRTYGISTGGDRRFVAAAVRPANRSQVTAIVSIAHRARVPIYPISTGRNWGYGCAAPVQDGCVVLDLSGLTGIADFEPDLGLITLEPGVTQEMLAGYLDARGAPFMVPVTGAGPQVSILGNALERGYGITPVTDHFLSVQSLEVVLADGRIYRPALVEFGASLADRAFKWGIGPYVDGIFTQGNVGVVTAITISLVRQPEKTIAFTFGLQFDDGLAVAVNKIRNILQRLPGLVGGINVMNSRRVLAMTAKFPHGDVGSDGVLTDAALARLAARFRIAPWTVFGTLYGARGTVAAAKRLIREEVGGLTRRCTFIAPTTAMRLRRIAERIPGRAGRRLTPRAALLEESLRLVAGRPSEAALALAYWGRVERDAGRVPRNPNRDGCGLLWYSPLVVMRGDEVDRYIHFVTETLREHAMEPLITLTSVSDRCFDSSVPLLFDMGNAAEVARANACYRSLLERGAQVGFVPYRVSAGAMDWLGSHPSVALEVWGAIKSALDPGGILSPGRYAPPWNPDRPVPRVHGSAATGA